MASEKGKFILADRLYRAAWLPFPILFVAAWLLISSPAVAGRQLEGGGSPFALVGSSFAVAATASALAAISIATLRRVTRRLGTSTVRRRLVLILGLIPLYLLALLMTFAYLFATSWAYDH
jgi:hypothetical protein